MALALRAFVFVALTLGCVVSKRETDTQAVLSSAHEVVSADLEKKAELAAVAAASEAALNAVKAKAADPVFLATMKTITLLGNLANMGVTWKRVKDLKKTVNAMDNHMQKVFVQRTEDCVRMRKLAFDASLLGLATELFVESLSKELASPTAKLRAEASAGPDLANAANAIDDSEGMSLEDKKKQAQLGIDMAEKIAEHVQKAKNAKGEDLGTSLVRSIREGTRGLRAAVDGVVEQACYASDDGELDVIDKYAGLDGELEKMQTKMTADVKATVAAALDAFDELSGGPIGKYGKIGLSFVTQTQALSEKITKYVIPSILKAFKGNNIVRAVCNFVNNEGLRMLMSMAKISQSKAQQVMEIMTSVIALEAQLLNKVDPWWLRALAISDAMLSILDNALKLFVKGNAVIREAMTYITETVNALVALVKVSYNWYAAKKQMRENVALVTKASDLAESHRVQHSWTSCRAFVAIDVAAAQQAALLNDFAAYVKDQGVVEVQQESMTAAVRKVFDRVCLVFAVGCSRILDSKVLPAVLRDAFTPAMKLKIRKLVTSGPISDVAVAMNKEQAAMLTAVGFERQGEYLFVCRACSSNVIVEMRLLGSKNEDGTIVTTKHMRNEYVENNILKVDGKNTTVKGVNINVQFLRRVFGNGRRPLVFVQVPLAELHKIPKVRVLVNIMANFEQLPRHQTEYSRAWYTLGLVRHNNKKETFMEKFNKLFEDLGYNVLGSGLVESHQLIKDFGGSCPDDSPTAKICTEWPYYWAFGALFAEQDTESPGTWPGAYKTPEAMRYRDHDKFMAVRVTTGYGCQFNKNLLSIGKIVRSSPVCYGAAGSRGKGGTTTNRHPRWDVWIFDVKREELGSLEDKSSLLHMIPDRNDKTFVLRTSDCDFADRNENSQSGRIARKVEFYANSKGFLSMDPEGLFTREIMGTNKYSKCNPSEMIHPVYMNARNVNYRMYLLDALHRRRPAGQEAITSASAKAQGVDVDSFTKMVLSANAQFRENIAQNLCDKRCGFVGDRMFEALGLHGDTARLRLDGRFLQRDSSPGNVFTFKDGIKYNDIYSKCKDPAMKVLKDIKNHGRKPLKFWQDNYGIGVNMLARHPLDYAGSIGLGSNWCETNKKYACKDPTSCTPAERAVFAEHRCNQALDKSNPKIMEMIQKLFDGSCDFRTALDVLVSKRCLPDGLGVQLRVGPKSGQLEEYCAVNGPYVRRYRLELILSKPDSVDDPESIDFQTGQWCRDYMHSAGYQLANFDMVGRTNTISGGIGWKARSVRVRVWVQADTRQRPIRDWGTSLAAKVIGNAMRVVTLNKAAGTAVCKNKGLEQILGVPLLFQLEDTDHNGKMDLKEYKTYINHIKPHYDLKKITHAVFTKELAKLGCTDLGAIDLKGFQNLYIRQRPASYLTDEKIIRAAHKDASKDMAWVNTTFCEKHCSFDVQTGSCAKKSTSTHAHAQDRCPECWWGAPDKPMSEVDVVVFDGFKESSWFNILNGKYIKEPKLTMNGQPVFTKPGKETGHDAHLSYLSGYARWGVVVSKESLGNNFVRVKMKTKMSPFDPEAVWQSYSAKKGWFVDSDTENARAFEGTPAVPVWNRDHWCSIAERASARDKVVANSDNDATQEAVHALDRLEAQPVHKGVCWEGSPHPSQCIALRLGHGVGKIVAEDGRPSGSAIARCCKEYDDAKKCAGKGAQWQTEVQFAKKTIKKCCVRGATTESPCGNFSPSQKKYAPLHNATACAIKCKNFKKLDKQPASCDYFAFSTHGICMLYGYIIGANKTFYGTSNTFINAEGLILEAGSDGGDEEEEYELYRMQ